MVSLAAPEASRHNQLAAMHVQVHICEWLSCVSWPSAGDRLHSSASQPAAALPRISQLRLQARCSWLDIDV